MHWIILGAIAVTLIVAAGRYPRFAFSVLAILLAFTFVMYQLIPGERERGVRADDDRDDPFRYGRDQLGHGDRGRCKQRWAAGEQDDVARA